MAMFAVVAEKYLVVEGLVKDFASWKALEGLRARRGDIL